MPSLLLPRCPKTSSADSSFLLSLFQPLITHTALLASPPPPPPPPPHMPRPACPALCCRPLRCLMTSSGRSAGLTWSRGCCASWAMAATARSTRACTSTHRWVALCGPDGPREFGGGQVYQLVYLNAQVGRVGMDQMGQMGYMTGLDEVRAGDGPGGPGGVPQCTSGPNSWHCCEVSALDRERGW